MKKVLKRTLIAASLFALPLVAAAQTPSNITTLIAFFGDTINRLIPVVIALAVLTFFWGLVQYIFAAGGGKAKKRGQEIMVAGLLGLFVMVSIWGLIRLLQNTLGVDSAVPVALPQVPQR